MPVCVMDITTCAYADNIYKYIYIYIHTHTHTQNHMYTSTYGQSPQDTLSFMYVNFLSRHASRSICDHNCYMWYFVWINYFKDVLSVLIA